jgi:hypothetical protein
MEGNCDGGRQMKRERRHARCSRGQHGRMRVRWGEARCNRGRMRWGSLAARLAGAAGMRSAAGANDGWMKRMQIGPRASRVFIPAARNFSHH